MEKSQKTFRNPWAWIPTLYFAQGIPYVVAMTVSVIMYKRLGISNTDIALYTSWLYLPWVIKPLWSPFVDMFKTKRFWVVTLQLVLGAVLAGIAFVIPVPNFFQYTLAMFWLMAFSSATHDIAIDGFYMLSLEQHQQAAFVGVRSTFYRIAMITGQGLLVIFAGYIESTSGLEPVNINFLAKPTVVDQRVIQIDSSQLKKASDFLRIIGPATQIEMNTSPVTKQFSDSIIALARASNIREGFISAPAVVQQSEKSWWSTAVAEPLEGVLKKHLGTKTTVIPNRKGNIVVIPFALSQAVEPGRDIVLLFTLKSGDNNFTVVEGERLTFNSKNYHKTAYAIVQLDPKIKEETHAVFTGRSGNIPLAWMITVLLLAAIFIALCIYHKFILPYPASDHPIRDAGSRSVAGDFVHTFKLFFQKKDIGKILLFLFFYRFAEAQLVKLVTPFLLDASDKGGLGLTTAEVGIVYGTVGIISLTLGGILGGYVISRQGLKFWLWPMVFIMHLPDLMFVYLSQSQPDNFVLINAAVAIEQFGYGFGFTAYMMYMILVSQGEHTTAHYALCTGFMALGMMLPGMFSGWLQETVGYQYFFLWVILSTIPGFLVAALVKIPEGFGRKGN